MYLPMIAFSAAAGLLLERVHPTFVTAIALVLITLSVQRTLVWRTEASLWSDAVEKSPGKVRPKIQLARASDPQRALELLEQARALAPDDARIYTDEGRVYLTLGRPAEALSAFGRALALEPGNADALNNRGAALLALGQREAARQDFERALKVDPCESGARDNLARLGIRFSARSDCE
jgi:tetratricopeptide (TPR) repeat protein